MVAKVYMQYKVLYNNVIQTLLVGSVYIGLLLYTVAEGEGKHSYSSWGVNNMFTVSKGYRKKVINHSLALFNICDIEVLTPRALPSGFVLLYCIYIQT